MQIWLLLCGDGRLVDLRVRIHKLEVFDALNMFSTRVALWGIWVHVLDAEHVHLDSVLSKIEKSFTCIEILVLLRDFTNPVWSGLNSKQSQQSARARVPANRRSETSSHT